VTGLALRTSLLVDALDADGLAAAAHTHSDSVTIDLASPGAYMRRADARRGGNRAAEVIAAAGRSVHARVSDYRSGQTEGDVQSIVRANLGAVVLAGAERPQDVRDIDVSIRKQEMRRGIEPGSVRLISEIDSAGGLRALPRMLEAVDRHSAIALDVSALADELGLPGGLAGPTGHLSLLEHAMAEVALTCAAAGVAWMLTAPRADAGSRAMLAGRAHAHGAAGAFVESDAEVQGFNSLFTPDAEAVQAARLLVAEWAELRKRGEQAGVIDGRIVDRRAYYRARVLVERAEAVAKLARNVMRD
jgi:citrate lyase subunit beta/citryl-CoA lyase